MHLMRRLWPWFFLAAITLLIEASTTGSQVDLEYKPQTSVTLHEPVLVTFTVRNLLSQPITIELGAQNRQFFEFALTTPDGQTFESHRNPGDEVSVAVVGSGKIEIAPGAHYEQSLLMNQWFEFKTVGTYFLASRLTSKIDVPGGESLSPQGETVRLVIKPRDPKRLERVCGEFAEQVAMAPTAEAAQQPARELSYVEDPIAIPYLSRILSTERLTYERAIEGLARIGNEDAIRVLLSALDRGGAVAESASHALSAVESKITSPSLRVAVQKAVRKSSDRARLEYVQQQIAYLEYRSPNLQRGAIENLANVQDGLQRAEPVLERLATDPSQPADVRSAAEDALQRLRSRKP